jgi:hypothetical protein
MSKTNAITILPNGTKISDLKAQAKTLKKSEGITHAEALDAIARQAGYESWEKLMWASWTLDEEGNLSSEHAYKNTYKYGGESFSVVMPLMDQWETWQDEDDIEREMSVVARLVTKRGDPYLKMEFEYSKRSVEFDLKDEERQQLGAALGGPLIDRVRAQVALAESVLGWIDDDQIVATCEDRCEMERHLRGITEDDCFWKEPWLAGYDANVWSVRVYDAGEDGLMVFYESQDVAPEEDVYGFITREQFNTALQETNSGQAMMIRLMEMAGLSED